MPMHLSDSERFWLGILVARLERLASGGDGDPLQVLAQAATEFGIGTLAVVEGPLATQQTAVPSDVRWAIDGECVEDLTRVEDLRQRIAVSVATGRQSLEGSENAERLQAEMEGLAQRLIHLRVCGFALSTPRCLYSLNTNGDVALAWRVRPHDKGLYLSLLRQLAPYIDLPVFEHMALCPELQTSVKALQQWTPDVMGIDARLEGGTWHPGECLRVLAEEFVGAVDDKADELDAYACGSFLACLESTLKDIPNKCSESIPDAAVAPKADAMATPPSVGSLPLEEWLDALPVYLQSRTSGRESQQSSNADDEVMRVKVAAFLLGQVMRFCEAHGLANGRQLLVHATHIADELSGNQLLVPMWQGGRERFALHMRQACGDLLEMVRDVAKLIYGDLRFREAYGVAGTRIEPTAQPGVALQSSNVRNILHHAVEQLNAGTPPYVTLNTIAPAVEVLVREVASRHVSQLRGYRPNDVLRQLREASLGRGDGHLGFLCDVGFAANALRNQVVHNPEGAYDQHHAQFLFHAVSLLLREL